MMGLINSEFFNVHMLFRYLFQAPQQGVVDVLVNKLYTEPIYNIDFYIP